MKQLHQTEFSLFLSTVRLQADLAIPANARGLILFAHGSGSSRLSPRNQMVADYLQGHQFATLLFDLLTPEEDKNHASRFNIELLASRLQEARQWTLHQAETARLPAGYFGASTGAAAALMAAAGSPEVQAVVSRGGRPDLAGTSLHQVLAPVLLIAGGADQAVLGLNRVAYEQLTGPKSLEIVPNATHLFEEPGAMEQVCFLAASWFEKHLEGKLHKS